MRTIATGRESATREAEEAIRLATVEPARAHALALGVLAAAGAERDLEAAAMAERALGLARRESDDLRGALNHLERSIAMSLAAGLPTRVGESRMSLSLVLAYAGDTDGALREADLAAPALQGADAARLQAQRALILQRLGHLDEALEGYRRALPVLRRLGDSEDEAKLLMNRGVLHAYRGAFQAAEADLRRAERLYLSQGLALAAAEARHNLGFLAAQRGDIPLALELYEQSERELARLGAPRAVALLDRCETLLSVRLVSEARQAAEEAAREFEASGMSVDLAEARVMLAQAALLAGDLVDAKRLAGLARGSFLAQRRPGWAALARYAGLQAVWLAGDRSATVLRSAHATVRELDAAGWTGPAADARLIAARIALASGRVEEAEADLRKAAGARRRGPAELRARAWHAEALLRHARGNRRGADAALRAGVRVLAQHVATLGATELRVHAAGRASELAGLGVQIALESGKAERVLRWAERCRAVGLRVPRARPLANGDVTDELTELRHVVSRIEECGFRAEETRALLRRQAALEEAIRRKTWRVHGHRNGDAERAPSVEELTPALGEAALVELVESDGRMHAVTVVAGRARLHSLGAVDEVRSELEALRFALDRLARGRGSPASRDAAHRAFAYASRRLDDLLLAPLAAAVGSRPLVVVPTGVLHALPWSSLPSCWGRPVSVCPSAAIWLQTTSASPHVGPSGPLLVAGPGLPHAADEVSELAAAYRDATTLQGQMATAKRVARLLDGADLVHVAAHGSFRADNPLFSSLRLADGPLTVYDLEALERAPRRLVLSACDAGLSAVRPGDELMGLSSALFSLGSETLVASVATVSDAVTRPLMVDLHHRLAKGTTPASALAEAQASFPDEATPGRASTCAFVCFGGG